MFLNLIKLLLSRAVERLTDFVSQERLMDATLADPAYRKSMESVTRELLDNGLDYSDLVAEIDYTELAGSIDYSDLVGSLDYSDLGGNLDYGELAGNLDYEELAGNLDLDYGEFDHEEIARHAAAYIDYDRLAALCRGTDMFREQVAPASPEVATDPVVLDLRGSGLVEIDVARPGLVERLLDLAVERLLALADEAAKEGKL